MNKIKLSILAAFFSLNIFGQGYDLKVVTEFNTGVTIGQFRAVPVNMGNNQPKAIAAIYSEDAEIDPFIGMFFFPEHTLKVVMFDVNGKELWKKDLGKGVVPGIWFSPICAFDLDQDGADEIWIIDNKDIEHPLNFKKYVLERLNPHNGEIEGSWQWPSPPEPQIMSHLYRHFVMGGFVHGIPVLITAQGTYGDMAIQGWNKDLSLRWEHKIQKESKGCRGSHVSPVVDINSDGVDDLLWGERCIELDKGTQLFCADENKWQGHSDIIEPVFNYSERKWYFFTCRETNQQQPPRVVFFDNRGNQIWGDLGEGHIDTGWAARLGKNGEPVVLGVKVGQKTRTANGERRTGVVENTFEAFTGKRINLGFDVYTSIPVDLNGDGIHELVKGYFEGDGTVIDREGKVIGNIGGLSAMASKFTDMPGEQILSYSKNGIIKIWADKNAKDNKRAKERYENPFYKVNQKQTGNGYNLFILGGI